MKVIFRGPLSRPNFTSQLIIGKTYECTISESSGVEGTSGGGPPKPEIKLTRKTPIIDPNELISSYHGQQKRILVYYKKNCTYSFRSEDFEECFTTVQEQRKLKLEKINGTNI